MESIMEGRESMCGRYYVASDLYDEIREFIRKANGKGPSFYDAGSPFRTEFSEELAGHTIVPATSSVIISSQRKGKSLTAEPMIFGFPGFQGSKRLINARAETVLTRPAFSQSMLSQRCLVPASCYYEWNHQKEKVTFHLEGHRVFYMAGIYRIDNGQKYFAILTTEANASVRPVHHRMPLILEESEAKNWLFDQEAAIRLLHKVPFSMARNQEYEQLELFPLG